MHYIAQKRSIRPLQHIMDRYAKYYVKSRQVIPYGAQNWSAQTLPHIHRPLAAEWAEAKSYQSYRLVFFENFINNFLANQSGNEDRDTLMLCTEIIWGSMIEACGTATCDEYTAWLLGELTLNGEHGSYAILCAMSRHSKRRGCGHKSILKMDCTDRIVLDAMYGETLYGREKVRQVNSQIIFGDPTNASVDYSVDLDTVRSLPLNANDELKLHSSLKCYRDYFRDHMRDLIKQNMPDGGVADATDIEICCKMFVSILSNKIKYN